MKAEVFFLRYDKNPYPLVIMTVSTKNTQTSSQRVKTISSPIFQIMSSQPSRSASSQPSRSASSQPSRSASSQPSRSTSSQPSRSASSQPSSSTFSQPLKSTLFSTTKKQFAVTTPLKINENISTKRQTQKLSTIINQSNMTPKKSFTLTSPISSSLRTSTTSPSKHVICVNLMGRLGNLMFEYAAAYGIARSKDMDVIISANEYISKIFHLDRGGKVVKDMSICRGVKTISEVRASAFDKETINFRNDKNVRLFGYLQSYKYFDKVSDEIRRQFAFRDSIKKKAEKVINDIFEEHLKKHGNETRNWTFIAVHVRRGDMVNHPHGYMVAPKEYFHRTQNMFRALYKHALFVVCSDDIQWCQNNIRSKNTYFVTGNSPDVDMAVLSSCNHTISSVGSFSWWSAWLGNGLVTYYFPPARPGSGLRRAYSKDYSDYFPPNWIKIS